MFLDDSSTDSLEAAPDPFQGVMTLTQRLLGGREVVVSLLAGSEAVEWSSAATGPQRMSREKSVAQRLIDAGAGLRDLSDANGFCLAAEICDRHGDVIGALAAADERGRGAVTQDDREHLIALAQTAQDVVTAVAASGQSRYLDVLNLARVGHWRYDRQARVIAWSDMTYELHGRDPALGPPTVDEYFTQFGADDRATMGRLFAHIAETGETAEHLLQLKRPDGETRHLLVRACPERRAGCSVRYVYGAVADITDLQRQIAHARRDEARYRLLADNIADVITRVRPDGSSKYISPAIYALLGWTRDEMSGDPLDYVHPDDREIVSKAIHDAVSLGKQTQLQHRAVHRDGTIVWVECAFKASSGSSSGREDAIVVIRNISDRKAMADELVMAKERAEKAAAAKSEFLANMSHELRTPLTSVLGFSGLLAASDALPDEERGYVRRISTASKALLAVINDVLDYSKLEKEAIELELRPFAPSELARDVADIVEGQCAEKGLELKVSVDPAAPASLLGDEGRLRQVLLNLLGNAAKFTTKGSVALTVGGEWDAGADAAWRLRVQVSDTGIGMTAETAANVFERFSQADRSTTRLYGGTGLGLPISKRLVEAMGGALTVVSAPGQGSTFTIDVPLAVGGHVEALEPDAAPALTGQARILVVDDTHANRELFTAILTGLGVEVVTASDGAEAVHSVQCGDFDLVLMDVQMPVMDGLTATREIRRQEVATGRHIPIVALSANVQPEQIANCREAGMDDHLAKPLQVPLLVAALSRWLS